MKNEVNIARFEDHVFEFLKQLEPGEIRKHLKSSYERTAGKLRSVALAGLHGVNIDVQGDRRDWDESLRSHIYSGGGGFLLTVRGRAGRRGSGAGELGMHKNRFFGKYRRKLPILQWLEGGVGLKRPRETKGARRKAHSTGVIQGNHFLRNMEPRLVQMAEQEIIKDLHEVLSEVTNKLS